MQCARCGHHNVSNFRFCEACLAPLSDGGSDDVVGKFFDDADLIEAGQTDASRGAAVPARFDLPWKQDTQDGGAGWTHELAMAGRDAELAATVEGAVAAVQSRRLSALVVHGEDGSGRSRLLVSARERLLAKIPGARILVTTGQGAHRPFSLVERVLRLRFDIPDYLGGTIAGERFERSVEAFYGDPAGAEIARTCGPMLGFRFWQEHDIDFEDRAEQTRRAREALYNLMARDLADPPTILVIDDAGEGDAESLEFFAQLHGSHDGPRGEGLEVPALLLLATDRRGAIRRPWLGNLPRVDLAPLPDPAMAAIAKQALAGVQGCDDAVLATLVKHANGRPGTLLDELEQLVKNGAITRDPDATPPGGWQLHADKLGELAARGSLVSGRGTRLGGLNDFQLQVLSMGAVLGTRFWLGGIVALLRQESEGARSTQELGQDQTPEKVRRACHALIERGLALPEKTGPLPHETGYRLVEESDRASLLELHQPEALKMLSQRAAVWLQMVAGPRASELAEVLAPLWLTAGDPVHAAHLYLAAGERALDEFRPGDARICLEKARELAGPQYAHVHWAAAMGLGRLHEYDGRWQDAEKLYRDALEVAWRFRARGRGAQALRRLGRMFRTQGKAQHALEHLVAAMKLFEAIGDPKGLAATCDDIGRTYWTSGHTKPALSFLKKAAQYREKLGDRAGLGFTLTNLGIVSLSLGHLEQARAYLDKAVQMQRERKNLVGLFEALNGQGAFHVAASEVDAAVACMEEAHEIARRVGNRRMAAMIQNNLGEVLMLAGRLDEGETLLYKAVEGAGRLGDHALLSDAARNLAVAARRRNDGERALKWARRSVAAAQSSDVVRTRATSQRTLGEILADSEDVDGADEAFLRAEEWLEQAGEVHELMACLQAHAAFLTRFGRMEAANKLLSRCDVLEQVPSPARFQDPRVAAP